MNPVTASTLVVIVLAMVGCQSRGTPDAAGTDTTRVGYVAKTPGGDSVDITVEGRVLPTGVREYLGIPFAEAPTGALRFRHARPKTFARSQSMRAVRIPAACPQDQGNPDWYRDVAENFGADPDQIPDQDNVSEDCLYLNIWTPPSAATPRAVMVWFHGGSNVNGGTYEPNYHGRRLALNDVVIVTIQSRLGPLGFLPLVHDQTGEVNFALSDQVEALRWIQNHIARFGGDPENVTAFGESAGGGNIAALMSGSAAKGLFHRAIIQSGAVDSQVALSRDVADKQARNLFEGLSITTAEQARARPWQDYIGWASADESGYYHYPVQDGIYASEVTDDKAWSVDLIVGTNRNEMLMYLDLTREDPLAEALDSAGAGPSLRAWIAGEARRQGWSNVEAADFVASMSVFHCPALQLAKRFESRGNAVYLYLFTRERPGDRGIRAYHGAEIPYVFDTHDDWLPTTEIDRKLTRTITTYWTNFAKNGIPDSSRVPPWSTFTAKEVHVQELGDRTGRLAPLYIEACRRWWGDRQ